MAVVSLSKTSLPPDGHLLTAVAKKHRDGSVLLSVADDRICKLNGVGALAWMILEQSQTALSVDEIVADLTSQFVAINAEGELCYDVPPRQLHRDTKRFLKNLEQKRLILAVTRHDGREFYQINDGVSATTSATIASLGHASEDSKPPEPIETVSEIKPSKRETFNAFLGLLAFDLVLHIRGFNALIDKIERWSITGEGAKERDVCRRVRVTVDRAQMYYPKRARCLQRSAVVTCLLRRRGVPAKLVLAAHAFPPTAHAWVEVGDEVVNASPGVKTKYHEFRRL